MEMSRRMQSKTKPAAEETPAPRSVTAEEVTRRKDLITHFVVPRWLKIMRGLRTVDWAVQAEQTLCEFIEVRDSRNRMLGAAPSGNTDARSANSGHKTVMTLNRESEKKVAKKPDGEDTATCPHLRANLVAKGGPNAHWVSCRICGKQWNRGFGMAKQNLRAPALPIELVKTIPPPRCPLPECRKEMILRQGNNCIFWGCRGHPEPKVRAATKDHCNFALTCYQSPPYQLCLFRDNFSIEELAEQSSSSSEVIPTQNFPTPTIASTLWIEAGATASLINPRSWLECQLSEKVNFSPQIRSTRTELVKAPTSTITIEEDASSSTATLAGDLSKEWAVVMEVDLDEEEKATIEAFQQMITTGGLTMERASYLVSTQPNVYLYTSQVGKAISKIISQRGL